ncbi:MAG: glycosyltransferase [Bacteroidota bacterium]
MSHHLCHLSLLNPLRHPRIYYKHALSARLAGYQVSVIAQGREEVHYDEAGIHLIPLAPFDRRSAERLYRRQQLHELALAQKADAYILHSPELLRIGQQLKRETGAKIIYDVHEDYRLNLRLADYYPWGLRHLVGSFVRFRERSAVSWLDGICYAEDCYENMLGVPAGKYILLPNTYTPRAIQGESRLSLPNVDYLLLSGTIAEERGLWESLAAWEAIQEYKKCRLVIAGHCQLPDLLAKLRRWIAERGYQDRIHLIGAESYVAAVDIQHLINSCYAGFFLYRSQPNLIGKYPTKLFEYLAAGKPLIYTDHPHWQAFDQKLRLGVPWKGPEKLAELIEDLEKWKRKPPRHHPEQYQWEAREEGKLLDFLHKLGLKSDPNV